MMSEDYDTNKHKRIINKEGIYKYYKNCEIVEFIEIENSAIDVMEFE